VEVGWFPCAEVAAGKAFRPSEMHWFFVGVFLTPDFPQVVSTSKPSQYHWANAYRPERSRVECLPDYDECDEAVLRAIHSIITRSNGFFSHGLELCRPDADTPNERKVAIIELDRWIGALHGIDPGRSAGSASYPEN
jgi:hypothetical protein